MLENTLLNFTVLKLTVTVFASLMEKLLEILALFPYPFTKIPQNFMSSRELFWSIKCNR